MVSLTSAINVQVDSKTKKEATAILNVLGLSMSTAINIFLKQIVKTESIPFKISNHKLNDNKYYKNCYDCHIEPDWLLVYRYEKENLILILINTGSHSDIL